VYGADINKHAALIYKENFGDDILRDVSTVDIADIPEFDMLTGGFPCQPFSAAGKGLGFSDTRGTLFFDICRIVDARKPEVVFLENVKNLRTHDEGNTFKVIQGALENLGYSVAHKLFNAVDFGVPQSRERIVIVATRSQHPVNLDKVELLPRTTLEDFILPPTAEGLEWIDPAEYVLLDESLVKTSPRTGLKFSGYIKANMRVNGVRENTAHLSRAHKQSKRIYDVSGTHPTISSQEKSGRYYISTLNPEGVKSVRKVTLDECFKLFGFPDTYKRVGAIGEQYARIGNSICVPMVSAVAKLV
jgi:DNA (cytosine-5)-methyltransferase 1